MTCSRPCSESEHPRRNDWVAGVMLDTNVYRDGAYAEAVRRIRRVVVSGVVVQELLVIASREQQVALIAQFREKLAQREGYVPSADDWCEVGKCLYRLSSEGVVNFGK